MDKPEEMFLDDFQASYLYLILKSVNATEHIHDLAKVRDIVARIWNTRMYNYFHEGKAGEKHYVGINAGGPVKLLSDMMNYAGAQLIKERLGVDRRITVPMYELAQEKSTFTCIFTIRSFELGVTFRMNSNLTEMKFFEL